ncbi:MAG: hypothetical protein JRH10_07400 [Deltaproteobacteria bacterium]|nr:hypothetical protein [Deltaproteobacteria bacterium]MBW2447043.1 hypothetical protein [Deltaproteobacteria bacterium]
MTDWNLDRMAELGHRHAQLEAERKLEPLMETLVPDAVYEFHPMGLSMRGSALVRRYYEQLIGRFMTWVRGYELLDEWVGEHSVAQEYDIQVQVDDGPRETHRVIGILFHQPRTDLLGGERIYGSERIVRLMVGDLYDELEPLR